MKNIFLFLITFLAVTAYSQTIQVQLDSSQVLQNSDAGSVACADIDQDGDQDLVITGSPGITIMYENDGNGNFSALSQAAIVNVYAGAAKFADVDNDGDQDLLLTGNTSSPTATANLYLNDGSGGFSLAANTPFPPSNAGDIDFGDMDGDNDLDLIMTGKDAAGMVFTELYQNNGGASFSLVSGTPFVAVWSSSTEFIDVDDDNDLDLLICGLDSANVATAHLYRNDGSGSFTVVTGTPFEGVEFGDIAFGDTDQDGDKDIFITGSDSNGQNVANLYLNNGTTYSLLPNTPFPGTSLHSAALADFNNDGKVDLLQIGNTSGGLKGYIYENQGANNFVLADSSLSGSYNGINIVADLNGDSKLDIVTTGTSFTAPIRAPKIYFNRSITVSAEDRDWGSGKLSVFPNPSRGWFTVDVHPGPAVQIEVFDLSGKILFSDWLTDYKRSFYLNEAPGFYLMRAKVGEKLFTKRIRLE